MGLTSVDLDRLMETCLRCSGRAGTWEQGEWVCPIEFRKCELRKEAARAAAASPLPPTELLLRLIRSGPPAPPEEPWLDRPGTEHLLRGKRGGPTGGVGMDWTKDAGEDLPFTCIASPVRNRAWVLPDFLECLDRLEYDRDKLGFYFLVNDSDDASEQILQNWARKRPRAVVERRDLQSPPDLRDNYQMRRDIFPSLAALRNLLLDYVRALGPTWAMFMLDSDALSPPHTLRKLVARGKPAISAVVSNDLPGQRAQMRTPNSSTHGLINPASDYVQATPVRRGCYRVRWTGAAFWVSAEALSTQAHFADSAAGEDLPFCHSLEENGVEIWTDGDVICDHILNHLDLKLWREGRYWDDDYVLSLVSPTEGQRGPDV